jgi:MoaA/NifB/PqqE/SkfB family radical SAM enzyme
LTQPGREEWDGSITFGGTVVDYEVEADWQLLNTCNYRCTYCFFPDDALGEKLRVDASPEEWGRAFDETGFSWLLHITGGEPSIYPGFAELCARLTRRHFISLNSNMTHRSWEEFAEKVDPKRVSFINAGLHAAERELKGGNPVFLKNVQLLQSKGFPVFTSLVATPQILKRFEEMIQLLAAIDMFPVPKALRAFHDNKWYPTSYTRGERRLFRDYTRRAREFYHSRLACELSERPTIDVFRDDAILHGEPNFKGLSCEAGHLFFKVQTNGDIIRCGGSMSYGNILKGSFIRGKGPTPCDTSYCFYFCQKYSEKPPLGRTLYRSARIVGREARDIARAIKPALQT